MRCPICESTDKWLNVDNVRLKKENMCMCEGCGFVSYPTKYKTEEEIKKHYRKEYRPGPQAPSLFTGERKLQYHEFFLSKPVFDKWREKGIDAPVVGEIGSAHGMFLNWIKGHFPKADIHGTELTETYRRVAFHEYGIKLEEDFDMTKKYDLITSYHVLEHQLDPDKKLTEYAACLKDDGIFYLSVPVWFRDASNSATGGFDIEYYWAPDHINCWSVEHLEHLIAKAGLEIIEKNEDIYGQTYLLKKGNHAGVVKTNFEYKKYLKIAENIFACWKYIQENKTKEAIEIFPNCPAAWINHYELNRSKFHQNKEEFNKFFEQGIKSCPNSADILMFTGDVFSRYERYDESYELLSQALNKKPNNPTIIMGIANCFRMKAKQAKEENLRKEYLGKSINLLRFVMATSNEMFPQALTWVYQDEASLPID
jgi:SAM-dependent methyltransferase